MHFWLNQFGVINNIRAKLHNKTYAIIYENQKYGAAYERTACST